MALSPPTLQTTRIQPLVYFLQPLIEDDGVGRAIKRHGCCEFLLDECGDQAGARATISRAQAVDFLAPYCPAMRTFCAGRKAALIHIYKAFSLGVIAIPALEITLPFIPVV